MDPRRFLLFDVISLVGYIICDCVVGITFHLSHSRNAGKLVYADEEAVVCVHEAFSLWTETSPREMDDPKYLSSVLLRQVDPVVVPGRRC